MLKKNALIPIVLMLTATITFAQQQQQQLSDLVSQKYKWVHGYAFEKGVTLNVSDKMWAMLTDENKVPEGANSFRILGGALVDISGKYGGSAIEAKCGTGINLDLEADNKLDCKKR